MFNLFKKKQTTSNTSKYEKALSYNLKDKPFTNAVILRAGKEIDTSKTFLTDQLGEMQAGKTDSTLKEFVFTSVVAVSSSITMMALDYNGLTMALKPDSSQLNYLPLINIYNLYVITNINSQVNNEGFELDYMNLLYQTTLINYMFHSENKKVEEGSKSIEDFKSLLGSDSDGIKTWGEALHKTTILHIMQWPEDSPNHKDTKPMFGQILSSLLKTMHHNTLSK